MPGFVQLFCHQKVSAGDVYKRQVLTTVDISSAKQVMDFAFCLDYELTNLNMSAVEVALGSSLIPFGSTTSNILLVVSLVGLVGTALEGIGYNILSMPRQQWNRINQMAA